MLKENMRVRTGWGLLCLMGWFFCGAGCSPREAEAPGKQPVASPPAREVPASSADAAAEPEPVVMVEEPVVMVKEPVVMVGEEVVMDEEPETGETMTGEAEDEWSHLPIAAEILPRLTMGALADARLASLPEGELIRAGSIAVGKADLQAEMDRTAWQLRELLRKYAFVVLEQKMVNALMEQEAREKLATKGRDVQGASQQDVVREFAHEWGLVEPVTDEDVAHYYERNRGLMGPRTLEEMAESLKKHIEKERLQRAVEQYVRELVKQAPVAVDIDWAMEQDRHMRNNEVDHSRESGRATMAIFDLGASGSSEAMRDIRQVFMVDYPERLNVIYVNASQNSLLAARYGASEFPHTVFFDQNGEVAESRAGVMTRGQVEAILAEMGIE